jgi:catechol 2,3-dioxygenase-like lactoylglutathione lyase family enzyme
VTADTAGRYDPRVRLHHLALRVADPARSAAFYAGVLGLLELRRVERDGRLAAVWLRAGECVVMLERKLRGAGPEAGSAHLVAFDVPDLADWERRLAAAGVAVADRTENTLYFSDPDGHRVAVSRYAFP